MNDGINIYMKAHRSLHGIFIFVVIDVSNNGNG